MSWRETHFLRVISGWRPFRRRIECTPAEMASIVAQAIRELVEEGEGDPTDWVLETLEKFETSERDGRQFQNIRAELHRRGLRHSKSEGD
jgi:hypothetical protein